MASLSFFHLRAIFDAKIIISFYLPKLFESFLFFSNRKCNVFLCICNFSADLHYCGNCYLCRLKCSCGEGMIACFIKMLSKYKRYSLDVLRDDDEMRFVCWKEGRLRRNQGESGSSGLV